MSSNRHGIDIRGHVANTKAELNYHNRNKEKKGRNEINRSTRERFTPEEFLLRKQRKQIEQLVRAQEKAAKLRKKATPAEIRFAEENYAKPEAVVTAKLSSESGHIRADLAVRLMLIFLAIMILTTSITGCSNDVGTPVAPIVATEVVQEEPADVVDPPVQDADPTPGITPEAAPEPPTPESEGQPVNPITDPVEEEPTVDVSPEAEGTPVTPEVIATAIKTQFPEITATAEAVESVVESVNNDVSFAIIDGMAYIATRTPDGIVIQTIQADKHVVRGKQVIFMLNDNTETGTISETGVFTPTPEPEAAPTPEEEETEEPGTVTPPVDGETPFDPESIEQATNFPCIESDDQACRIILTVENVNQYGLYTDGGAKQIILPDGTPTQFYIEASVNAWTRDNTLGLQNYEVALIIVDSETGKRMVGGKVLSALPLWTLDHFLTNISAQFYFQGGQNNGQSYDSDTDSWYLNPDANKPTIDPNDTISLALPVPGKDIGGGYLPQGVYDFLKPLLVGIYGSNNQGIAGFETTGMPDSLEPGFMRTEDGRVILIPGGGTTLDTDNVHNQE